MIVCESIIDTHIFEKPANVSIEEAFNFLVVELRVDENSTYVRFYDIGKTLRFELEQDILR